GGTQRTDLDKTSAIQPITCGLCCTLNTQHFQCPLPSKPSTVNQDLRLHEEPPRSLIDRRNTGA
ncbi:MAG: hypothetical protein VX470_02885, partial [Planctomycetota bacterium]|nr:hypothetical protein [Planctomycetota bacterium]